MFLKHALIFKYIQKHFKNQYPNCPLKTKMVQFTTKKKIYFYILQIAFISVNDLVKISKNFKTTITFIEFKIPIVKYDKPEKSNLINKCFQRIV